MRTKLVNEFGEAASSRSAPFRALVRRHIQIPSAALVQFSGHCEELLVRWL